MLCICLKNTDPYFCLAAEEYFLKNYGEKIFMLWQSDNTVVVGKHQNALAEINYRYTLNNNIKIARRISGGGTVFHDSGNVNFAYIKNVDNTSEINFNRFTGGIIHSLSKLQIDATSSGRSDLLIRGKKISGNAEHIYKNRVLHHGTLLFNSNLATLGAALNPDSRGHYQDKAVKSRKSEVTNIYPFLNNNWSVYDFIEFLSGENLKSPGSSRYLLTGKDQSEISALAANKFRTWEWNFGYSPKYIFINSIKLNGRELNIRLNVVKGVIKEASVTGNYFSDNDSNILSGELQYKRHIYEDIKNSLQKINTGKKSVKSIDYTPDKSLEEKIYAFF